MGRGGEGCRRAQGKRLSPNSIVVFDDAPLPHQQMSSSVCCDSHDLITVFPASWLFRALTGHPFHLPCPLQLTSKEITSLCANSCGIHCPHPFQDPCFSSLRAGKELLLEGKGVSRLEPSDEPDSDSASEPEGPLAIIRSPSSVACPSSPADKWQSRSQRRKEPLRACSTSPQLRERRSLDFQDQPRHPPHHYPQLDFHSDVLSVSQTHREGIE